MGSLFMIAFLLGAAGLALWIDARFPELGPRTFSRSLLASVVAVAFLLTAPVAASSVAAAYASLFGFVLPALVATFLAAAWLVRSLGESRRTA